MVDWGVGAGNNNSVIIIDYPKAFLDTRKTGSAIVSFVKNNKMTLSKVYCVGHSLGAHVSVVFLK